MVAIDPHVAVKCRRCGAVAHLPKSVADLALCRACGGTMALNPPRPDVPDTEFIEERS